MDEDAGNEDENNRYTGILDHLQYGSWNDTGHDSHPKSPGCKAGCMDFSSCSRVHRIAGCFADDASRGSLSRTVFD
ncbi:hypothetical protein D3C73_1507770 [compost metagenome]